MPISVLFSLNQIKLHFLTPSTTENSSSGVFSIGRSGTNVGQIHEVVHNSPFCGGKVVKKEDEKQDMENKNNEVKKELSKNEHNPLEIQAEMPGLSSSDPNLSESNENIDKKNDNDGNNEEDLKIPSFLRNQSN